MPSVVFVVAEISTSTGLSNDTVKVNVVVPLFVSVTEGLSIEIVAVSSLVIVPVASNDEPTSYPVPDVTVSVTVSFNSTVLSSVGLIVTMAVLDPARNVTVPEVTPKVAAPVCM